MKAAGDRGTVSFRLSRWLVRTVFRVLWRHRVEGTDNIPPAGGVIIAPNHRSYADPPLVGISLERAVHFLAKKELFSFRPFGALISRLNAHAIDRRNSGRALRIALALLKGGNVLIVFPEGGRSRTETFRPAKRGIALIAKNAGVPIVPTYVHNSTSLWRGRKTLVRFGPPIMPDDFDDHQALADATLAAIGRMRADVLSGQPNLQRGDGPPYNGSVASSQ